MIEAAREEGNKAAEISFVYANEVEKIHAELYSKLLDGLGGPQGDYPYFVCPVCGFTAEEHAPDKCPICGTKAEKFTRVD